MGEEVWEAGGVGKWDDEGAEYVCHILRHDYKHVEPIWLANWHIFQQQPFFFSLSLFSVFPSRRKVQKADTGDGFCGICWHRLIRKRERGGGETYKETQRRGESKKSCGGNTVAACGSSFPLESGKSRCAPLTWSLRGHMIGRPRYAEVYGSSLLPGLWKNWREEKRVLFFFQTCCVQLTWVSQHAECVFHIKCNTDDCLVQLLSWIRQAGGPLALEHFLYLFYISAGPVRNKIEHDDH